MVADSVPPRPASRRPPNQNPTGVRVPYHESANAAQREKNKTIPGLGLPTWVRSSGPHIRPRCTSILQSKVNKSEFAHAKR
jgi:hypothetical protein